MSSVFIDLISFDVFGWHGAVRKFRRGWHRMVRVESLAYPARQVTDVPVLLKQKITAVSLRAIAVENLENVIQLISFLIEK